MPLPGNLNLSATGGSAMGGNQRTQLGDIRSGDISTGGGSGLVAVMLLLAVSAVVGGVVWLSRRK